MRTRWSSGTQDALSPLAINVPLIGRKWPHSRTGLILETGGGVCVCLCVQEGSYKVGSSGGNSGGKLILCFLCQSSPQFQVMTQHLVTAAVSRGRHARVQG